MIEDPLSPVPGQGPCTPGGGMWQPPSPAELEQRLPQYRIIEVLGVGGMGAVYKGFQTSLERYVAIKILSPGLTEEDAQYAERFKQEAKTMARLSHPGIVGVYDFGQTADGLYYIVMEFVEGTDVQQMVTGQGRLESVHALAIAMHVCDALAYAHRHGIIHRDIKPANVMVDTEGRVKVADFGLAKGMQPGSSLVTGTGMAMGTPDFVAPEVLVTGMTVDQRADLYAVGVMLYQMLTGKVPRGRFEHASVRIPGLDPRYDGVVDRAMQEHPDARYATAEALRADLMVIHTVPLQQRLPAPMQAPARPQPGRPRPGVRSPAPAPSKSGVVLALVGIGSAVVIAAVLLLWKPWAAKESSGSAPVATSVPDGPSPPVPPLPGGERPFPRPEGPPPRKGKGKDTGDRPGDPPPRGKPPPRPGFPPGPQTGEIRPTADEHPPAVTAATASEKQRTAGVSPPFTNSLGMKFVPVPGIHVLFCIHETRRKDYAAFASETPKVNGDWKNPQRDGVPVGSGSDDDPVVSVSWDNANAFCAWLSKREGRKYRLPTDREWSFAAGIGARESATASPESLNGQIKGEYPWGNQWPPPKGSANLQDQAFKEKFPKDKEGLAGYNDGFATTAPVMSFMPNPLGIYDLAGNAWEWCSDLGDEMRKDRVIRGGSWFTADIPSSRRKSVNPGIRVWDYGFRCVVEPDK